MPPQLHSLYLWDIQIGNLHAGFCFSLDKRHTVSRCAVYRTFFSCSGRYSQITFPSSSVWTDSIPCCFIHSMQYAILCSSFPVSVWVSVSSRSVCSASSLLFRQKFRYSSSISHFLRMKYDPSFFVFPFCSISLAHAGEIFCNFFCCFFVCHIRNIFFCIFPVHTKLDRQKLQMCAFPLTDFEIRQHTPIDLLNFVEGMWGLLSAFRIAFLSILIFS